MISRGFSKGRYYFTLASCIWKSKITTLHNNNYLPETWLKSTRIIPKTVVDAPTTKPAPESTGIPKAVPLTAAQAEQEAKAKKFKETVNAGLEKAKAGVQLVKEKVGAGLTATGKAIESATAPVVNQSLKVLKKISKTPVKWKIQKTTTRKAVNGRKISLDELSRPLRVIKRR
jgi:hypothetical protein